MHKRLVSLYAGNKKHVFLLISLTSILSAFNIAGPYIAGRIIDLMSRKEDMWIVMVVALCVPGITGSKSLVKLLRQRVNLNGVWFPIQEKLRMKTIDRYFSFSIGQLRSTHSGLSREIISNGEHSFQALAQLVVNDIMPAATRLIVISVMLVWLHLPAGLIVFTGFFAYGFAVWKIRKKYIPRIRKVRDASILSSKHRGELLTGATLIKSFSKEEVAREKYRSQYLESINLSRETSFYTALRNQGINQILTFTQYAVAVTCIYLYYRNKMTLGQLIMVRMWCEQVCDIVDGLGDKYQEMLIESSSAKRFLDLIDTPPAIREIDDPIRLSDVAGAIQFKHVSFGYPKEGGGVGKNIIDDLSLFIHAKEKVAIVGPSGSGKSTLMTLLLRGYDPNTGAIEVDGNNLRNLSLKDYYRHIAVVDQASLMMDMSIRDNIMMGSRASLSDEEILSLCKVVDLDIDQFSNGLDTRVGESGNEISGGEKQRIAIARALAGDPRILILDEPTSSLDAIKEARIRSAIDLASRGRTTITIAHRLVTVQNADRIFLMEKGQIVAMGTHRELLQSSGLYMQLVQEQKIEV